MIAVLYNYITIPFREAFNIYDDEDNMTLWYILNSLMDTLYLLDILILKPRIEFLDQGITKVGYVIYGVFLHCDSLYCRRILSHVLYIILKVYNLR